MALNWNDPAEVKKRRELAIKAGYKSKDIDEFITKKRNEFATLELGRQGVVDIGEIAKTSPQSALSLSQEGIKPKGSAEEQKQTQKLGDVIAGVNILEKNLNQINARGPIAGNAANFIAGLTGGKAFTESADYEALRKSLIGPLARAISGEVGVLTDRDISRAEGLLPKAGDDPKLATKKLNNLKSLVAEKGGPKAQLIPENKQNRNPIVDFLLGGSLNVAQDISSGINANLTGGRRSQVTNQAEQTASQFEEQAMATTDMRRRKDLLQQANNVRQGISQQAQEVSQSFSPDVTQNPLWRGVKSGSEVASLAALPALGKSLYKLPSKARGLMGGGNKQALGQARDVAANLADKSGIKYEGKELAQVGKNFVENNPEYEKLGEKILPKLEKRILSNKDLIKQIQDWSRGTYSKAGDVKSAQLSQFRSILADEGRRLLRERAPEVAKYSELFSKLYGREKFLGKLTFPLTLAAGAGVTGALGGALGYKLLGNR